VLDGEQVRTYGVADGLQIGTVMTNHPGRIGHWFGGELGLARLDGERFYSIQSAPDLPLDGITGIVETTDGDLWLNGRPGIVHVAATELERSRLDPAYLVRGETLGAFDGVVGSGAMLRPLPTAIEAADGKLWFATTGGIYGIDPARRVHNRVPPSVLIRALTVAGHTIEPIPGLTLPTYTPRCASITRVSASRHPRKCAIATGWTVSTPTGASPPRHARRSIPTYDRDTIPSA
jgi:ligand-binding sensor domain-containing protein